MTKLTKLQLEELLDEIREYRGHATELITVYVPAGYDPNIVQKQLEAEKATAKNIKSTGTRKNVTEALDKVIRYLKDFKKAPENGLALFSGNVSKVEGQDNMQLWAIEPPEALCVRIYRCDKAFVLEALEVMLQVSEVYALLVMDRKEATIGTLEGKKISMIHNMTSGIPGKVRAGGQSSQRFHRITEGLTKEFYKRIADEMKKNFFQEPRLKGIIVGGPIPTKDEFLDNEYLMSGLKEKVIGRIDLGDTSETGLGELVERSEQLLANQEIIYEKNLLKKFFETLGEKPDLARYKLDEAKKALEFGAVDTLIFTKGMHKEELQDFKDIAKSVGTTVEMVSTETDEGVQFKNLGGVGALLRYKI